MFAGGEVVFCLFEDPRVLHGGAADHEAGYAGFAEAFFDVVAGGDIAVADDGDRDGFGALADDVPVGLAGVALGAGAAVDGNGLDADVLEELADVGGID